MSGGRCDVSLANGIPVAQSKKEEAPFSCDANLLHISYEGNALEDPWYGGGELSSFDTWI